MKQMVLTQEEFLDWTQHSVTKAFFKSLSNNREELKEGLVSGLYDESVSNIQGRCAAVSNIINATYEDVMEGLANG